MQTPTLPSPKAPHRAARSASAESSRLPSPLALSSAHWMLALIAWTILPLALELPLWLVAVPLGLLLWRARLKTLPTRWWLIVGVFLWIALVWLQWRSLLGRDAGVSLLIGMLALKTLESKTLTPSSPFEGGMRDAWVIFYLAFITLLTHFLFSQTLLTALAVISSLVGWIVLWVYLHLPTAHSIGLQQKDAVRTARWQKARRTTAALLLAGTPIMLALFMVFPRFAPLWGLPSSEGMGKTGLSDSMQIGGNGSINQLAQDSSIALRLDFKSAAPATQDIYIRGPVLDQFDGQRWTSALPDPVPVGVRVAQASNPQSPPVTYTVTLESADRPWLLTLDATLDTPKVEGYTLRQSADLRWFTHRPITQSLRYEVSSHLQYLHRFAPGPGNSRLPKASNPRTVAMAQTMLQSTPPEQRSAQNLSRQLLTNLRTGGYQYSLSPGIYGVHNADEFWFDKKIGFCEHFAASYVIAMRAMGIPARVVTGYQGAERNPLDAYWVVRQSNAHAWAEIWDADRGWLRVDPTAEAAPQRILEPERFVQQAGTSGAIGGRIPAWIPTQWLWKARHAWEATNNRWNQWVLNYAQEDQLGWLKRLGYSSPNWLDLITLLGYALLVFLALAALWSAWQYRLNSAQTNVQAWQKLLTQARSQLQAAPHATPRELMQKSTHPDWLVWLAQMERHQYAQTDGANRLQIKALARAYQRLPR